MFIQHPLLGDAWPAEPPCADPASEPSTPEVVEEWDPHGPSPAWEDLWDAFESDDEVAEPQPEYGDFWDEPDEPEI